MDEPLIGLLWGQVKRKCMLIHKGQFSPCRNWTNPPFFSTTCRLLPKQEVYAFIVQKKTIESKLAKFKS